MSCQHHSQVQAYYDDAQPDERRAEVESHLRECPECMTLLLELRTLSNAVRGAERASMPADAMKRLEQAWWRRRDRGVLRLAEWLTAAAAAVIIATLLFWSDDADSRVEPAPRSMAWQADALTPPAATRDDAGSDVFAVAEWMANDLSPDPLSPDQR